MVSWQFLQGGGKGKGVAASHNFSCQIGDDYFFLLTETPQSSFASPVPFLLSFSPYAPALPVLSFSALPVLFALSPLPTVAFLPSLLLTCPGIVSALLCTETNPGQLEKERKRGLGSNTKPGLDFTNEEKGISNIFGI